MLRSVGASPIVPRKNVGTSLTPCLTIRPLRDFATWRGIKNAPLIPHILLHVLSLSPIMEVMCTTSPSSRASSISRGDSGVWCSCCSASAHIITTFVVWGWVSLSFVGRDAIAWQHWCAMPSSPWSCAGVPEHKHVLRRLVLDAGQQGCALRRG